MLRKKLKMDVQNTKEPDIAEKPSIKKRKDDKSSSDDEISPHFQIKHFWTKIDDIECNMSKELMELDFGQNHVYNPLVYARHIHVNYMAKYLDGPKKIVFVGMNPGPYGMAQTGVPFGYVPAVRDWMKLKGDIYKPDLEIVSRPVDGFDCKKVEQSGRRFWGLFQSLCDTPEIFFKNCFVYNWCPLAFFGENAVNVTPVELKGDLKKKVIEICTNHLKEVLNALEPMIIISVGKFVDKRIQELYQNKLIKANTRHLCISHPSPRSVGNTNWNEKSKEWLVENGLMDYFK